MPLYEYPDRLSSLALKTVGDYVTGLLVQLVMFPQYAERQDFKLYCVQPICKHLEKMIMLRIPLSLATEVTMKLVRCMDPVYCDLITGKYKEGNNKFPVLAKGKKKWNMKNCCKVAFSSSKQRHAEFRLWCQQVAEELLCAIFHPLETNLDTTSLEDSDLPVICDGVLNKLRCLKVLRLGYSSVNEESLLKGADMMENLEEFSYSSSWDELLESLSKSCKRLRILDIHDSIRVTDASVDFILKFRRLEELNISDTCISQGVAKILEGFAQTGLPDTEENPTSLTKLSTCFEIYDCKHISLLADNFPYLKSLSLSLSIDCSLAPLKNLKHLTNLSLCERPFFIDVTVSHVEETLRAIGPQLSTLHLEGVSGFNLRSVCENCPSLRCLDLHFVHSSSLGFPEDISLSECSEKFPLPEFQSVECLDIFLVNCFLTEYIVSRCVNARKIHIRWRVKETCIRSLLQRMAKGQLDELSTPQGVQVNLCGQLVLITKFNKISKKHTTFSTSKQNVEGMSTTYINAAQ